MPCQCYTTPCWPLPDWPCVGLSHARPHKGAGWLGLLDGRFPTRDPGLCAGNNDLIFQNLEHKNLMPFGVLMRHDSDHFLRLDFERIDSFIGLVGPTRQPASESKLRGRALFQGPGDPRMLLLRSARGDGRIFRLIWSASSGFTRPSDTRSLNTVLRLTCISGFFLSSSTKPMAIRSIWISLAIDHQDAHLTPPLTPRDPR